MGRDTGIDVQHAERQEPANEAPMIPITVSPSSASPCPSAMWLARKPATNPTKAQIRIVSSSRVNVEPLMVMTALECTPIEVGRHRPTPISRVQARFEARSPSTAPSTRLNAGKGWMTSAS